MNTEAARAIKLALLAVIACLVLAGGLWLYLATGLVLGLVGPFLAVLLFLYVGYDVYDTVVAA